MEWTQKDVESAVQSQAPDRHVVHQALRPSPGQLEQHLVLRRNKHRVHRQCAIRHKRELFGVFVVEELEGRIELLDDVFDKPFGPSGESLPCRSGVRVL